MPASFDMGQVFAFQLPGKIIFGNGAIGRIGAEIAAICPEKKILLITDAGVLQAGLTEIARKSLENEGFEIIVYDRVLPDAPLSVIEDCVRFARTHQVAIIFGIGGGSVIDTAKAVSVMAPYEGDLRDYLGINKVKKPSLPKIFVPTTAGTGSEISNAFVVSDPQNDAKFGCYSPYTFADLAIVDPMLTLSMPPRLTAESGMDAFSHALESFVTVLANPLSDLLACRAIELISQNIRRAYAKGPQNLEARYAMCLGTCLGTMAIRSSALGIVHATSNPVVMKAHVTHGAAIALMMPAVMEYNLIGNLEKYAAVALAMGERTQGLSPEVAARLSVVTVKQLIQDLNLPTRLRDVGVKKEDLPEFAKGVLRRSSRLLDANPRNATHSDLVSIYNSAW